MSVIYYHILNSNRSTGVIKTAIINMVTARYFQEDRKSVCEWITECRTKAYELNGGDSMKKGQSSIARPMATLYHASSLCYLMIIPPLNS